MTASIRLATPGDSAGVVGLLQAADLPTAGLQAALPDFLVAEDHGRLVGAIGLEVYGDRALLRSAVVDAGRRNSGLGSDLVECLVKRAHVRYFPRFGFRPIARSEVALVVRDSEEFRGACPDSAVAMRRVLEDI